MGGDRYAPAALPLRKRPSTRSAVGYGSPKTIMVGGRKCRPPPRFDPRIIQPVASLSTDCAISAHCRIERVSIRLLVMPRVRMLGALSAVLVALCLGIFISQCTFNPAHLPTNMNLIRIERLLCVYSRCSRFSSYRKLGRSIMKNFITF